MWSALLPALVLAAASPTRPLSVTTVEVDHDALTGRTVEVVGTLAECQPLSCGLLGDSREVAARHWLSFAFDERFDREAAALVGHRVVVEGVVLATCWPPRRNAKGKPIIWAPCTDRAPQFKAVRIVRDLG